MTTHVGFVYSRVSMVTKQSKHYIRSDSSHCPSVLHNNKTRTKMATSNQLMPNLQVSKENGCIKIHQSSTNKSIFVPEGVWDSLRKITAEVDTAIQSGSVTEWDLSQDWKLATTDKLGNGALLVDIRRWWSKGPTRQGIAFKPSSWVQLKGTMYYDVEEEFVRMFADMTWQRITEMSQEECIGCQLDRPGLPKLSLHGVPYAGLL